MKRGKKGLETAFKQVSLQPDKDKDNAELSVQY